MGNREKKPPRGRSSGNQTSPSLTFPSHFHPRKQWKSGCGGRISHSFGVTTGNSEGINNPRVVSMASLGQDWELFMSVGLIMPRLMPNLCHWLTQALKFLFFSARYFLFGTENLPGCLSNIPTPHVQLPKKIPPAEFSPSKPFPNIPMWCVDILWGAVEVLAMVLVLHWALRNVGKGA